MKKVFLSVALCAVAFAASAQLKSVDAKLDPRGGNAGFGVGATFGLIQQFELAPSFSWYFPGDDLTMFTIDANLHYLLPEFVEKLELYPLVGVGLFHYGGEEPSFSDDFDDDGGLVSTTDEDSDNEFLLNIGAGARYHFHDQWACFAEEKYQFVNGYVDNYISLGISYTF